MMSVPVHYPHFSVSGAPAGSEAAENIETRIIKKLADFGWHTVTDNGHGVISMRDITADDLINAFEGYVPFHDGFPTDVVMDMLNGARGPVRISGVCSLQASVMMASGANYGVVCHYRTTYAGLGLLDHWAKKYPGLVQFTNIFIPQWCRDQIACESFDAAHGVAPKWALEILKKSTAQRAYNLQNSAAVQYANVKTLLGQYQRATNATPQNNIQSAANGTLWGGLKQTLGM